jgi:DNA polymerase
MQPTRQQFVDFVTQHLDTMVREGNYWLPQRRGQTVATVPVEATPKKDSLQQLAVDLQDCQRCKLSKGRKNIVISRGNPKAELMFIGEGPGHDEDVKGLPFVGKAGQLLDKIVAAMGFARDDVYIANVVKCRPPENRAPESDEVASCSPFLKRQIDLVAPKIICTLGTHATQTVLKTEARISTLRGEFHMMDGIPVMPTYHPAFLLRTPEMKRFVWEDMKKICKLLGREPLSKSADGKAEAVTKEP